MPVFRSFSDVRAENAELRRVLDRFSDAVAELLQVLPRDIEPINVAAVRAKFDEVNAVLRGEKA